MSCKDCNTCVGQVEWVCVAASAILAFVKFLAGYVSGSWGLLASGLHSTASVITAVATLISRKVILRKDSTEYHYGLRKVEFLAAACSGLIITLGAGWLIAVSIKHLLSASVTITWWLASLVAIISIVAGEILFRYMHCAGSNAQSRSIIASAGANRVDSVLSMVVLAGIIGSRLGIPHLDPIAAVIVVAAIIKTSATILIHSLRSLMDVSVNDQYGEEIKDLVRHLDGIRAIEAIKTRKVGNYVWAELDVVIDSSHSLKAAAVIGNVVKTTLLGGINDLERVTVNTRPLSVDFES
jgi:cation diffusion facilitator family transporter